MAFGEKGREIERLEGALADALSQRDNALEINNRATGLVGVAIEALEDPVAQLAMKEDATVMAVGAVGAIERERLTGSMATKMQEERYEAIAAQFRAEDGPGIKASLEVTFAADGTFRRIDEDARAAVTAELQDEVRAGYAGRVEAELTTPEAEAEIKRRLAGEMESGRKGEQITAEVTGRFEEKWGPEVLDEVRARIGAKEESREEEYKAQETARLLDSRQIAGHRNTRRNALEREWADATLEEVLAAVNNEELEAVVQQRIDQIAEETARQEEKNSAADLLKTFKTGGIDTDKIPADVPVVIWLGEVKKFNVTRVSRNGYNEHVEVDGVQCDRKLKLMSLGGGEFSVKDDSINGSSNVYAQDAALSTGTVVTVGTALSKNGKQEFEHKITADSNLFYDNDTSDDEVVDSRLPVANITINGVSARDLDHVEHHS